MKFILTATYTATRMTIKEILKLGTGQFIEHKDDDPAWVHRSAYWLQAQNPSKKVWRLTDEEITGVITK